VAYSRNKRSPEKNRLRQVTSWAYIVQHVHVYRKFESPNWNRLTCAKVRLMPCGGKLPGCQSGRSCRKIDLGRASTFSETYFSFKLWFSSNINMSHGPLQKNNLCNNDFFKTCNLKPNIYSEQTNNPNTEIPIKSDTVAISNIPPELCPILLFGSHYSAVYFV